MPKHPNLATPRPTSSSRDCGTFRLPTTAASASCCSSTPATTPPSARAVLLLPRQRRGVRRARGHGGGHLVAEPRVARGLHAKHGLNVPLLADKGSKVAKLYGAHAPVVGTKRAVIIVDEDGVVGTATTTCSGSTSRPSATCARRSSRCRRPVRDRDAHHPGALQRAARVGQRRLHLRAVAELVGAEEVEVSLRAPPPLERPLHVSRRRARRAPRRRHARGRGRPAELLLDVPDAVPATRWRPPRRRAASAGRRTTRSPPASSAARTASPATACGSSPASSRAPGSSAPPGHPDESVDDGTATCGRSSCGPRSTAPRARRSRTSARAADGARPPDRAARLPAARGRAAHAPVLGAREDGRKRRSAAALYDSDGISLCASRALWIELRAE